MILKKLFYNFKPPPPVEPARHAILVHFQASPIGGVDFDKFFISKLFYAGFSPMSPWAPWKKTQLIIGTKCSKKRERGTSKRIFFSLWQTDAAKRRNPHL
jgi:hypothetical protein